MEFFADSWVFRVVFGLGSLGCLAAVDVYRHVTGRRRGLARIREYGFLFGLTGMTIALGLLHDRLTWGLSPEYYSIGKQLGKLADTYYPDVAYLAAKASWSLGLTVGLAYLIANSPRCKSPQLPYRRLGLYTVAPLVLGLTGAAIFGTVGLALADCSIFVVDLAENEVRSRGMYLTVWMWHLGVYVGVVCGVVVGIVGIRRERKRAVAA